ncbi:MAG: two-component system, OmpR family, response regulator MprA, partial [Acidimicrobiaceae bacterium]|nr:two-component system, OmpR family, response regulator MprA [Acidimicrobiaceae bacterium]
MSSVRPHAGAGRILIAEDDQRLRESLARVLAFEGYDVALASDGVEALEAAAHEQPDLIILDVMMPNLD